MPDPTTSAEGAEREAGASPGLSTTQLSPDYRPDEVLNTQVAPAGNEQRVLQAAMLARTVAPAGFAIENELGRGGMGIVYLARQAGLNRTVALKMILGDNADSLNLVRFLAEAEVIASVKHPQVVEVYQFGEVSGRPYLALEYCPGGSLGNLLSAGQQSPLAAAELIAKVADGVEAAHAQGIVHRDLKPQNVLFAADGTPKVTDFGLAKKTGGPDLTKTNAILGTPAYMSPEQAQGGTKFVGPPADVWSLGVMLYEMLTGSRPFEGESTWGVLAAVMSGEFVAPRKRVPGVPRDLELICLKCLQTDPRDRYSTAGELATDLRRFINHEPVSVRPAGSVERLAKWSRKNRALAASLAAITAALLIGTGVSVWQAIRARDAENAEAKKADEAHKEMIRADEQSRKFAEQVIETRRLLDHSRLREAQSLYGSNLVEFARDALEAVAPENRDVCWSMLKRVCEGSIYTGYGHTSVAYAVAWSPDGHRIATAGEDRSVRIWDATTGQCVHTFRAHEFAVWCLAWSPDGRKLASGSADTTIRIWDTGNWMQLASFEGHRNSVVGVAWSPDGRRLASANGDFTARIWDAENGDTLRELRGHTACVWSVAWSPDGSRLVTGSIDKSVRIWDAATGNSLRELKAHTKPVRRVAWSPDGLRVASASEDNNLRVWDPATGESLFGLRGHGNEATGLAWSPDGRRLASCAFDKTLRVWEVESGDNFDLKGHENGVECVVWSPDGRRVASVGWDNTLRVWNAEVAETARVIRGHTHHVLDAVWSPDGKHFASAAQENTVRIWDAVTGQQRHALNHDREASGVAWSPDSRHLVSIGFDQMIRIWNAETGKPVRSFRGGEGLILCVAWSPDGTRIVTGSDDKKLLVWDAATGAQLQECKGHTNSIWGVAWSPDSQRIASASEDKTVRLWNAATGESQLEWKGQDTWIQAVAWSPDGKRIASSGSFKSVCIWDARSGTDVRELKGHTHAITTLAWSPDGTRLASGSDDGSVRVWDTASWQSLVELKSGAWPVNAVAWSPDGRNILTGKSGNTLRLWEPHRWPVIRKLRGHKDGVEDIRVSADGRFIVSKDLDEKQLVWDARTGELLEDAAIPELAPQDRPPETGFIYVPNLSDVFMIPKALPAEELTRRKAMMAPDPYWHREQAESAEKEDDWFAAAFHLRQLVRLKPGDPDAKRRLSAAEQNIRAGSGKPKPSPHKP